MNEEEKQALIIRAEQLINHAEEARDETPFGLSEDVESELALIKIALSAMTAEPVAWRHNNGPFGKIATCSENAAKRWEREGFDISPLYTTPPAPEGP
ncbi:hypothetical protein EH228_04675 [Erwinia endophytica]|uniref:hypothetical protein n=1 Tax=Erwinia endophytica TaxID=1563158 RepID=UPI001266052A|nr:hypothetical protein [Erwinia endophytica]KAB8312974.1 hypothetical protein EH228_04675 [Erwinia endophytica]